MKPFGIRLAAGAVTILLGALAAAQAQKDRGDDKDSSWSLAAPPQAIETPAPISAIADDSAPAFVAPGEGLSVMQAAMTQRASQQNSVASGVGSGVQQVQYNEPTAMPIPAGLTFLPQSDPTQSDPSGNRDLDLPSFDASAANSANESPQWAMPAEMSRQEMPASEMPASEMPASEMPASEMPAFQMTVPSMEQELGVPATDGTIGDEALGGDSAANYPQDDLTQMTPSPSNLLRAESEMQTEFELDQFVAPAYDGGQEQQPQLGQQISQPPQQIVQPQYDQPQYASQPQTSQPQTSQLQYAQSQTPPLQVSQPLALQSQATQPQPLQPQYNAAEPAALAYDQRAYDSPSHENSPNFYPPTQATERIASRASGTAPLQHAPLQHTPLPMQTPIAAQPVAVKSDTTLSSPGDRRLEGIQSPSIVIQKRAPAEVKVGKPASFVIHVRNVGSVEALDVQIHDRVPQGMRLVDASPAPSEQGPSEQGDLLVWNLGVMPAGDERTVTMQLVPEQEGELGSVARVTFEAAASVRTVSTRPELKIVQRAPEQVLIGQQLEIEVEVSNPGTGSATGVMVQEDVPDGLEHPKGKQLDNFLGELAAGEVRHQILRLRAVAPGIIENQIVLRADDGLTATHSVLVEVIAPEVQIGLAGPSRRFLERQATYQLEIANTGTADATNVEIVAQLDRGFTFVSTDYEGQYDPSRHAVYWSLANLPKGKDGKVPLTLLPVEEGSRKIMIEAKADLGTIAKSESFVTVESLAQLSFQISDSADPIEVGGETTYEIRLSNSGSRDDSNVRVQLQLPPGIEHISADGDAQEDGRGGIFFAPKTQMAVNSDLVYRVRVRGTTPGTHLVKAIVTSDQSSVPVTKEESTMVYSDR